MMHAIIVSLALVIGLSMAGCERTTEGTFERDTTSLHLIAPNGSETLTPYTDFVIRWSNDTGFLGVSIRLSTNGGYDFHYLLCAETLRNTFLWRVPDLPSNCCKIQIWHEYTYTDWWGNLRGCRYEDMSDDCFTIVDGER